MRGEAVIVHASTLSPELPRRQWRAALRRWAAAGREAAGATSVELELPGGAAPTAGAVLAALRADPRLGAVAARSRLAVNHAIARPGDALTADDELALIPPVGGG
jgi:molybdopterin converting factor small subunit